MKPISAFRLNLLRASYLLLVVGLGSTIWPVILDHPTDWELRRSVVAAMLGALSLLAVLGLRQPLKMLPLLMFEVTWKGIWLLIVALPSWRAGRLDAATTETAFECLIAVLFLFTIPWDHLWHHYIATPAEPWGIERMALRFRSGDARDKLAQV